MVKWICQLNQYDFEQEQELALRGFVETLLLKDIAPFVPPVEKRMVTWEEAELYLTLRCLGWNHLWALFFLYGYEKSS